MQNSNKAFTLVELIVVIVILAILATIAFLSFSSQSASARDSTRLADMNNIAKGLSVFSATSGGYPKPDSSISVLASGATIGYQGYAGNSVLNMIKISNGGKDPLDTTTYYTYSVNSNSSKFQILGFLEDGGNISLSLKADSLNLSAIFADPSSYSGRYVITKGDTLGILLSSGSMVPMQSQLSGSFTGIDIVSTTGSYMAIIDNKTNLIGSGANLQYLKGTIMAGGIKSSCNNYITANSKLKNLDGLYTISSVGNMNIQAYCDMTTDGGGWTLVANASSGNTNHYGTSTGTNLAATGAAVPFDFEGRKLSDAATVAILGSQGIFRAQVDNSSWTVYHKLSDNSKFSFAATGGANAPYRLKIAYNYNLNWESDSSDVSGYLWGSASSYKVFDSHNALIPAWFASGYYGKRVLWGYNGNPGVYGNGLDGVSHNGMLWVK